MPAPFEAYSGNCVEGPLKDQNQVKTVKRFKVIDRFKNRDGATVIVSGEYEWSDLDQCWIWLGPDQSAVSQNRT